MGHMGSGLLIQQAVISFSYRDMLLLFAYHVMEYVGINSGCVDHISGMDDLLFGFKIITFFRLFDIFYLSIK